MKIRISTTIEPSTKKLLDNILKKGRYRNISHIVEDAVKLLGEKDDKNKRK